MKYLVKGIEPGDNNEVDIPDDVSVIGVMYHPVNLKLLVVALMPVHEVPTPEEGKGKKGEAETLGSRPNKVKPKEKGSDS